MRNLLLASVFITVSFSVAAQSVSTPQNEVQTYQQMKEQGTVPANFQFTNAKTIFAPSLKDLKESASNAKQSGGCGCYVAPDATYTLAMAPNDDGSTGSISIPFNFCLYGTNYTNLFINNNGNVSFGTSYSTFSSSPFPSASYVMVAPFWGDVDTRGAGTVKYKITPTAMYVNWEGVGYYSMAVDKLNSFQLIITDGSDPVLPPGNNIAFCYGDMQWTTGSASSGVNGFGGIPATVGVNKGDGVNFIQIGRFDQPGAAYDGGGGANDGISWLDNQSFFFNACSGTNIAPIANFTPALFNGGGGACDTLRVCGINDTLLISSLFLSPEIGQTTTVGINLYGTPGFSVLSNTPGNPANSTVQIIASPANAGMNTITYTATDDGVPVQTTIVNLNIFVDTTGLSAFNPAISGVLDFCSGSGTTLTVTPSNFDSYIWNTGSIDTSISVTTGGEYWVTSELNGCYKTVSTEVIEHPLPTPAILGTLFTCSSNPTTLYLDSANLYTSYTWSNASTNDSIVVLNGTYTVTVTDSFGCTATSPSVVVVNTNPAVSITGSPSFCQGDSTTLTAVPSMPSGATYLWSTGSVNSSISVSSAANIWVTVTYNNGCFANDTFAVAMIPTVFGSQNSNICQGDNFTLPSGLVVTQAGAYIDTLSVSPSGCDSIVTTNLTVTPLANATITAISPKCENNSPVNLTAANGGGTWSGNGITNASTGEFTPATAGIGQHLITYTIAGNCGNLDTVMITVNPVPSFSLEPIEDTCLAFRGTINSTIISGSPSYSYFWDRGDVTPNIYNVLSGTYTLTVTDGNNCAKSIQVFVDNMGDDCNIIAPNVITPNGDGSNDFLVFDGLEHYPGSSLVIFNRWGNKIFESNDYQNNWGPEDISDGTYFYILTPGGNMKVDIIKSTVSVLK